MLPTQHKPTRQERIDAFLLFYFEGIFKPPLNTDLGFLRKLALIIVMIWGASVIAAVLWGPIFLGFVFSITLFAGAVWLRQWRETQDRQQQVNDSPMRRTPKREGFYFSQTSKTHDSPIPKTQKTGNDTPDTIKKLSIFITWSAMIAPMILLATLLLQGFLSHKSKVTLGFFVICLAGIVLFLRGKPWGSDRIIPRSTVGALANIILGSFTHILIIATLMIAFEHW